MKIVTFNVRCTWDGPDSFLSRMGLIYEKINREKPDVVGFQEVTPQILDALKCIMPGYVFVGHGRNADLGGEGLYTAVREETTQVVNSDTFWIAPDPEDALSKFADQSTCPRICVAAQLRHRESGKKMRVYNLHLDHVGKMARADGMACVLNRLAAANARKPLPAIVLGDFNALPQEDAMRVCRGWSTPALTDVTAELPGTFHNYGRYAQAGKPDEKIDYIFLTEELNAAQAKVAMWTEALNGHWLSDHYPVCAELEMN